MQNGKIQGSASWNNWIQTNDNSIIEKNLDNGTSVCLFAVKSSITGNGSIDNNKKSESIIDIILSFFKKLLG